MISENWLNLKTKCSIPFRSKFLLFQKHGGQKAAANDLGVMLGMHDIGT